MTEVAQTVTDHRADPAKRVAQRKLAADVTRRVHGAEAADQAVVASEALFKGKGGTEIRLDQSGRGTVTLPPGIPRKPMAAAKFGDGVSVVDALVWVDLASSKADARRGIQGKGYSLNGIVVTER